MQKSTARLVGLEVRVSVSGGVTIRIGADLLMQDSAPERPEHLAIVGVEGDCTEVKRQDPRRAASRARRNVISVRATLLDVAMHPRDLSSDALDFLRERHLATLTTLRRDGRPHVVPVGFTWDLDTLVARVITSGSSQKAVNAARSGPAVICQVDGRHWLSLEGRSRVLTDAASVTDAVERYAVRYRQPRVNPTRVVIEVAVTRILGNL